MVKHSIDDPSPVLNQLSSLVQDELHIVTYKYFSRKFNVPFDISKRMLYRYFSKNRDTVDATYFLSGWTSEVTPQHVVKVVDHESLENEKASLSKVNSLHIFSIQPRRMATAGSLYENDLGQSIVHGLPEKLVSLGRVGLEESQSWQQEPQQEGKPTSTEMRQINRKEDFPALDPKIDSRGKKDKEAKDERSRHADPLHAKKARNHEDNSQFTKTENVNKRKKQIIDSDDEGDIAVHGDKKYRTYINDNGEEEIMVKSNQTSNRPENARMQEASPPAQKKASKPKEQRTIASFFSKRN